MWPHVISESQAPGNMHAIFIDEPWGVQTIKHVRQPGHTCSLRGFLPSQAVKQNTKEKLTNIPSLLTHRSKHIDGVLQL